MNLDNFCRLKVKEFLVLGALQHNQWEALPHCADEGNLGFLVSHDLVERIATTAPRARAMFEPSEAHYNVVESLFRITPKGRETFLSYFPPHYPRYISLNEVTQAIKDGLFD